MIILVVEEGGRDRRSNWVGVGKTVPPSYLTNKTYKTIEKRLKILFCCENYYFQFKIHVIVLKFVINKHCQNWESMAEIFFCVNGTSFVTFSQLKTIGPLKVRVASFTF